MPALLNHDLSLLPTVSTGFGAMIGNSPEMRKTYQVIEQAAPTGASVLIIGESGVG